MTDTAVTGVQRTEVQLKKNDDEFAIPTWTVIWGAGVKGNKLGRKLAEATGTEVDGAGRIPVTRRLSIEDHETIFAIGDIARCPGEVEEDGPLPSLAAVAMQQGEYLAKQIAQKVEGVPFETDFKYVDKGTMATIGRSSAVAKVGNTLFTGFIAWVAWMGIHLLLLIQFQNRMLVFIQWAWNYLTFSRNSRLILGVKWFGFPGDEAEKKVPAERPNGSASVV